MQKKAALMTAVLNFLFHTLQEDTNYNNNKAEKNDVEDRLGFTADDVELDEKSDVENSSPSRYLQFRTPPRSNIQRRQMELQVLALGQCLVKTHLI